MTDLDRLRVEKEPVSDRDLLLELLHGQRIQNGELARIKTDYYGNLDRDIKGTKPIVAEHDRDIAKAKTYVKAYGALLGIFGVGTVWAWVRIVGG